MLTCSLGQSVLFSSKLTYNMVSLKPFLSFCFTLFSYPSKLCHLLVPTASCTLACPNLAAHNSMLSVPWSYPLDYQLVCLISQSRDLWKWSFGQGALSFKKIRPAWALWALTDLLKWWRQPSWHQIWNNHCLKCYDNFLSILFLPRMYSISKKQKSQRQWINVLFSVKCRCLFLLKLSLLAKKSQGNTQSTDWFSQSTKEGKNVRTFFCQSFYILAWTYSKFPGL